jgi:cupin superfamily acireductone dioxygenase involved in methionine salvage
MYNKKMKKIISKSLELDILNIETKSGYNGADILHISSTKEAHIEMLRSFVKFDVSEAKIIVDEKTIYNGLSEDIFNLYCVFSEDKKEALDYIELK